MRNDRVVLFPVVVELMPQHAAGDPWAQIHLVEKVFMIDAAEILTFRPHAVNTAPNFRGRIFLDKVFPGGIFLVVPIVPLKVVDYVNNKELGIIQGATAKLRVKFEDNLLLEVTPA